MKEHLNVGAALERVAQLYAKRASVLLPAAVIVYLVIDFFAALVYRSNTGFVLALVSVAVTLIGTVWYLGFVVEAARESAEGEPPLTMGRMFQKVEDRIWPLIWVGFLAAVGIAIGFVLLIIPGLILITWWAVVAPAIVVEHRGFDAFGRSRDLVRGNAWRVFAVVIVVFVAQDIIVNALRLAGRHSLFAYWGLSLVGHVITAPLVALTVSVLYFELRRIAAGAGPSRATEGPPQPDVPPGSAPTT